MSISAAEKDIEIEDDLAKGAKSFLAYDELISIFVPRLTPTAQKILRDLKARISSQSKKNFVLEKDVRYLDSRIALLIQNRMALEEVVQISFISSTIWLTSSSKTKLQVT